MASRVTGRRRWTFAVCAVLVGVAVLAVAFQGAPDFTGPRVLLPAGPALTGEPRPQATGTSVPQESIHEFRIDLSWVLVALTVLAIVIALALAWRFRRRPAPPVELPPLIEGTEAEVSDAPRDTAHEPEPERVLRGLDRASAELAEVREPRDAIERAWVGLEEGAADSGVRRLPAETPAEFTARVVARVAADQDAAQRFLALYLRARFSSAPVAPEDVANARSAVEALRASWSDGPRGTRAPTSAERFGSRP
ncbi:DUF4129 domain-containing protein [Leifsonia sp. LS-T14]|uniref:DUF4129 domain-containing protein n=1 Tax=unclassified Leifsonia TaxID=2663824 RepID=UPI0035A65E5C